MNDLSVNNCTRLSVTSEHASINFLTINQHIAIPIMGYLGMPLAYLWANLYILALFWHHLSRPTVSG